MKPYTLLLAFGGLDDATAEETMRFLAPVGGALRRRHRNLARSLLLAAALTLLLAACGYMAYRATMSHRELNPSDEMRYYLKRTVGDDLTLNMGTCALALEFDTEATGTAHAFRVEANSGLDPDWELGAFCPTFRQFLDAFTPETNARMADFPDIEPLPDDQIRTIEQSLQEAGLTEEEADTWLTTAAWFGNEDGVNNLKLRIDLYNGPWLNGIDLICGWPEGEADIVKDDTWNGYQRLEAAVHVTWKGGETETINYLFLFQPEQQYLLVLMAHPEDLDFARLEQAASAVQVLDTDFSYRRPAQNMNWSVLGFASG